MTTKAPVASRSWPLWSTAVELVVVDSEQLEPATALLEQHLGEVEAAVSRFRDDSEIRLLPARVSPLFARHLAAGLWAAEATDGLIDPTVGTALRDLGYDRDIALLDLDGDRPRAVLRPAPGWRRVGLDGTSLSVPPGIELDLGATAKALAADEAAAMIHKRLGTGVLVNVGGDLATAGPAPEGGWSVRIDADGAPPVQVTVQADAALATSSTRRRRWTRAGVEWHHIVDPRTGGSAEPVWQSVSVAAQTCLVANVASTAAIVAGAGAVAWLTARDLPARLVRADGGVVVTGGWPDDPREDR